MKKRNLLIGILGGAALLLSACSSKGNEPVQAAVQATEQTTEQASSAADTKAESESGSGSIITGIYPDGSTPEFNGRKLRLTVDGNEVVIALYDNTAVDVFLERLPLENLEFYDLSGIEKPMRNDGEPFSIADEEPGYDPVTGEMVIYRPWGNFTIFYGDFRHSDELVPLGIVESGLEALAEQTEDFVGSMELAE